MNKYLVLLLKPLLIIRRNHALEHATLNLLAARGEGSRLAGYSDKDGFWVVGEISTELLQTTAQEALTRLRSGEVGLAIHPGCGTNYAASGAAAGFAAWLGMLGVGKGFRRKIDRLPTVILLATVTLMIAQPLGPYLQKEFTTDPKVGSLQIMEITRYLRSGTPLHRIRTHI
ncbi:MAG TPA: DUF6391 domain-containing protein [Longilinea sp.]|nr:DUF6391 domain-containing protein [Longilinea sp.]